MPSRATQSVYAFVPQALAASRVGAWESDITHDVTSCDAEAASLYGVDPELAANGLPLRAYAKAIHPGDLGVFNDTLGGVRRIGGLFVVEYRTRPAPGELRWLLVRGRYERDARTGEMMGRGIVIDITESKLDGHVEDRAFSLAAEDAAHEEPVARAADHAIAARKAIDQVEGPERPGLRRAVDALLWALGGALARRSGE